MTTSLLALFSGKTPAANGNLFTTYDSGTDTYVRNASNPLGGIDLTGVPLNSIGALVTRKHWATARHASPGPGTVVKFLDSGNSVVTRTVTATVYSDAATDLCLLELDTAVPNTVTPFRLFDSTVYDKYNVYGFKSPAVWIRWHTRAVYGGEMTLTFDTSYNGGVKNLGDPEGWNSFGIGGDSGSPMFALLPNETVPVLLSCMYFPNVGPHWGYYSNLMEAIVQAAGENFSFADLSSYPDV